MIRKNEKVDVKVAADAIFKVVHNLQPLVSREHL